MNEQNQEFVVFPEDGFTRRDLMEYYARVAPLMLPHIENRPLVVQRFPDNIHGECILDKNAAADPAELRRLAGLGCVTPHAALSSAARPDNPQVMIFDLDPSADNFIDVADMAIALRDILALLGLRAYAMTTGSRGVHVAVPLDGTAGFDMVRQFAFDIGRGLVDAYPDVATAYQASSRQGMVFVNTRRIACTAAAVAPYAVRALKGAPVAAPLTWDELADAQLHSQRFNLRNMIDRLNRGADPWKEMWTEPQSIAGPRKVLDSWIPAEAWRAVA